MKGIGLCGIQQGDYRDGKVLVSLYIAEVVGSNPTQSTYSNRVRYGIKLSSFSIIVLQKA